MFNSSYELSILSISNLWQKLQLPLDSQTDKNKDQKKMKKKRTKASGFN